MSERLSSIQDDADEIVEAAMFHHAHAMLNNAESLLLGVIHPHWQTAEGIIKAANQALDQLSQGGSEPYYFAIRYVGEDYQVYRPIEEA